jgi:hypothetical protein
MVVSSVLSPDRGGLPIQRPPAVIVPSFIALGERLDAAYQTARRVVSNSCSAPARQRGVPGPRNRREQNAPSPFNTAQIIHGLLA